MRNRSCQLGVWKENKALLELTYVVSQRLEEENRGMNAITTSANHSAHGLSSGFRPHAASGLDFRWCEPVN